MPWKIRFYEQKPENPTVGDAWYVENKSSSVLSENYHNKNNFRNPIMVVLPSIYGPDGDLFLIDRKCRRELPEDKSGDRGWEVSGDKDNITISPSINCVGSYHGYIKKGIISDDVEGRIYERNENWIKETT